MKLNGNPESGVKALISAAIAFILVAPAFATTYYLRQFEGGSSANAWTSVDCWTDEVPSSSWPAAPSKSSSSIGGNQPPGFSADDGFVIPVGNGVALRVPTTASGAEWNGKYLQVGGAYIKHSDGYCAIVRQLRRGEDVFTHYKNDGLVLAADGKYLLYYSQSTYNITGTVSVVATDSAAPAKIEQGSNCYSVNFILHDKFKSQPGTYCTINSTTNRFNLTFKDTTEYCGTLTVTNVNVGAAATVTLCTDFPGTMAISRDAVLRTAENGKICNLKVLDGAVIDATAGAFSVTGSFDNASAVTVRVDTARFPGTVDLVSGPAGMFTLDDFVFADSSGAPLDSLDSLSLVETAEGVVVRAIRYPTATLTTGDNNSRTKVNDSSMTNSAHWTNAESWPDSETMPGGWHYALSSSAKYLRTAYSGEIDNPKGDVVFPGISLTLPSNTGLVMLNPSFACTNLVLDGGQILPSLYVQAVFTGKITVTENGGSIYSYLKTSKFESEIEGSGDLRITGASGSASGTPFGYVWLSGLNTNFTGAVTATIPNYYPPGDIVANTNKITPRFDRNYMHLQISDKRNLGGPLAAVNPQALTLQNMSRLELAEGFTSLMLDEPTRGVFVKWVGRFLADSGQTMTLASPLAVHGTMWKEGAGTLVLANPQPTFGADAVAATPDVDATNRMLRVAAGTVRVASGCAVNGLDVVVADGATLALDLASGDADMAAYGIRNELTPGTPFAADGAAANVYIDLVPPADYEGANEVPVVTVKATDADSVDSLLVVRKPTDSGRMRSLAKSRKPVMIGETACVTFTVNTLRHGLAFTVK